MGKTLQRILFVDDDPDIHVIVKICLREIPNLEFRSVFSGQEALKILGEFEPDLILLDLMMPYLDGIQTLEAIRSLPKYKQTPVVFLTAKVQKNEVQSYFQYGIADVIVKPFDPSIFAQTVQEIWKKATDH